MELSRFFNSIAGDRRYLAEDWAAYFSSFIGNGVFPQPTNGLQVIAGNVGATVIVRPGRAWINGYFYTNDDELTLQLPIAHGVLRRIDRIVIRWDMTERRIFARVNSSPVASNPIAPPLQRNADAWELCIADVMVNAGATTISQANITDRRWNTALCGIVVGVITQIDPSFITAQFNAFFEDMRNNIQSDYTAWQTAFNAYMLALSVLQSETQQAHETFVQQFADLVNAGESNMQGWFNSFTSAATSQLAGWYNPFTQAWEQTINDWFDSITTILDGDVAANLANRITQHEQTLVSDAPNGAHGIHLADDGTLRAFREGAWVIVGGVGSVTGYTAGYFNAQHFTAFTFDMRQYTASRFDKIIRTVN